MIGVDHRATAAADEVDMRTVQWGGVDGLTVLEGDAGGDALLDKQLQRAVNGGDVNRLGTRARLVKDLLGGEVLVGMRQDLDDHLTLGGEAKTTLAERLEGRLTVGHCEYSHLQVIAIIITGFGIFVCDKIARKHPKTSG